MKYPVKQCVLGGVILCFGHAALAATDASLCTSIKVPEGRLACFDEAYSADERVGVDADSAWTESTDQSMLDDSTNVYLTTIAKQPILDQYGNRTYPHLWLRCRENTTSAYIDFGGPLMSDNRSYGMVSYRVDDRTPSRIPMDASTDNKALGLWGGGNAIKFIKTIIGGAQLFVRATPYSASPVEFSFDISGLEGQLAKLRETCGW